MNKKVTTTPPKNNFKHTELGWIPKDWEVKKLKDFGVFSKGKGITKKEVLETFTKGISCIRYAELYTKYNYYTESLVSRINKKSSSKSKEISHGTILFAGSGETLEDIGKSIAYIGKEKAFAGGDIITFDQDSNNSKFLGFLLNYDIVRSQLYKLGQGHSVVHIYSSSLKNVSVPLPTLPEQQAIADCLSTWDVAIDKQQQLINVKEQQHKGLRQLLLTGKKRLINPETEHVFAENWKEKRLKDALNYEQPTKYIVENSNYSDENKTPVLTANKSFVLGYTEEEFGIYTNTPIILFDDFTTDNKWVDFPFKVKSSAIKILTLKDSNFNLRFIFERIQLLRFNKTDHKRYYISEYQNIKLKTPTLKEQTAIAKVLETSSKEIKLLQEQLYQLQLQKRGLMQVLLSGEKRLVS
ncbi:restriction endonuclease subunit S [Psychroflexus sp. CAK57W]|uniref:restriction endonuclease subunit S n=1 Tax=Psychroflexus curvus TaxID=2873595 RepID=UPI001CCEF477|nr:restriction endonuclease subunit S [Psychroflexus curvus]MBZ9788209.1 restriction endonuclease subunit S [Psychroflexus curvus]